MHSLIRALLVVAVLTWSATGASAATFVVNSTLDTNDAACTATPGGCTLREAMAATVASPGLDTIAFDPAVFPPGDPAFITLMTATPVLDDPAGTIVDGAGAGVRIDTGFPIIPDFDILVFANSAGTPLQKVRVANVTVRHARGTGIFLCGGAHPGCDGDVVKPVIENVVVEINGRKGILVEARDVTKARFTNVVTQRNGHAGIEIKVTGTLSGTKIEVCTAQDDGLTNGGSGINLESPAAIVGTSISDTITVDNDGAGIRFNTDGTLAKTKLTRIVATRNLASGIFLRGFGALTDSALTDVTIAENGFDGVQLFGSSVAGTTVKNMVTNRNGERGLVLSAFTDLTGAKITGVRAVGNTGDGIAIPQGGAVSGVQMKGCVATANGGFGLRLAGSGHVVKRLRADGNGGGIQLEGPGSGSVIQECTAHGNDGGVGGRGIRIVAGNTGNLVTKNAAQGNDGEDLEDGNVNCDNNLWKDNFAVTNAACLD